MNPAQRDGAGRDAASLIRLPVRRRAVAKATGWACAALRQLQRPAREADSPEARNLLLLEPFGLGDVISLQPLVERSLRAGRQVAICARAAWSPLFEDTPGVAWVNSRAPWSSYDQTEKYRLKGLLSPGFREFVQELRGFNSRIGIDTRGDPRSVLLLRLCGFRRILSLSHYLGYNVRSVGASAEIVPYDDSLRRWEMNLRFAQALGLPPAGEGRPSFPSLGTGIPEGSGMAGLLPVAPWKGREWPEARWRELAGRVESLGLEVVVLCGPGQESQAAEVAEGRRIIACQSIRQWAAELAKLRFLVSLDTGPMHLADALGIPVVALYGTGKLPLWAPSGELSCAIHHQMAPDFQACHPTEKNVRFGQLLMERTTVPEVFEAVCGIHRRLQGTEVTR